MRAIRKVLLHLDLEFFWNFQILAIIIYKRKRFFVIFSQILIIKGIWPVGLLITTQHYAGYTTLIPFIFMKLNYVISTGRLYEFAPLLNRIQLFTKLYNLNFEFDFESQWGTHNKGQGWMMKVVFYITFENAKFLNFASLYYVKCFNQTHLAWSQNRLLRTTPKIFLLILLGNDV